MAKESVDNVEHASTHEGVILSEESNRLIVRKLDWKIIPVVRSAFSPFNHDPTCDIIVFSTLVANTCPHQLCFTYVLQNYDKAVISQAAIFGLRTDLGLESGLRYSWVSLIFYFGHMVGMYPCSLIVQRFHPKQVCSLLTIVWAITVLTTPACNSYAGILANRSFLGLVESGVSPVFMMVAGLWYMHEEQAGLWDFTSLTSSRQLRTVY